MYVYIYINFYFFFIIIIVIDLYTICVLNVLEDYLESFGRKGFWSRDLNERKDGGEIVYNNVCFLLELFLY
jgi:hypothetical protein